MWSGNLRHDSGPIGSCHRGTPDPVKIDLAEAVRVSIDFKNGRPWLLIDPDSDLRHVPDAAL